MKIATYILFGSLVPFLIAFGHPDDNDYSFKKYIKTELIGKKQVFIDRDSTIFETTYLGILNMKEGNIQSNAINYHVFAQFYSVQAAISRHGHSRIVFVDASGKTIRIYTLGMPNELPTAISDNALVFETGVVRNSSLPELFCIPESGCYE